MGDWLIPPKIKIYEALGAIGDKRISIKSNEAEVFSSSGGKSYLVKYDPKSNSILANDNGSYWKGYLGYPSIAFLMLKGILRYDQKFSEALKGIQWKDVNVKFKNDFEKTEKYVQELLLKNGINLDEFLSEVDNIHQRIKEIKFKILSPKIKPPAGY